MSNAKPRVSVHKFSSCDGCQLAFLNLGEALLDLTQQVELVHFAEAGMLDELAPVDIAFVEGSISTPADVERIQAVRAASRVVVTIGACATSGGLQALRNLARGEQWAGAIYASPEYISTLESVAPIRDYIHVDLELWGCPVDRHQVLQALAALGQGFLPAQDRAKVCMECKLAHQVCVVVAKGEPCMGPVTRLGCGALCPSRGRGCYACYGPAENINHDSLLQYAEHWRGGPNLIQALYQGIYSHEAAFQSPDCLQDKRHDG